VPTPYERGAGEASSGSPRLSIARGRVPYVSSPVAPSPGGSGGSGASGAATGTSGVGRGGPLPGLAAGT
jgi:hypothetical protein